MIRECRLQHRQTTQRARESSIRAAVHRRDGPALDALKI